MSNIQWAYQCALTAWSYLSLITKAKTDSDLTNHWAKRLQTYGQEVNLKDSKWLDCSLAIRTQWYACEQRSLQKSSCYQPYSALHQILLWLEECTLRNHVRSRILSNTNLKKTNLQLSVRFTLTWHQWHVGPSNSP